MWWLNAGQEVNDVSLKTNLQALYTGLVGRNIISRQIPVNKQVTTNVKIKTIKIIADDKQTFEGDVHMLDYMTQKPMVLNLVIHVKDCSKENRTAVFVEVSPKPQTHSVWKELNQVEESFRCSK